MNDPLFKNKGRRKNGLYYANQLQRAIENNPEFIFISGWNDWQYQNQIEPAVEYGYKYVEITAKMVKKAREEKF